MTKARRQNEGGRSKSPEAKGRNKVWKQRAEARRQQQGGKRKEAEARGQKQGGRIKVRG